MPDATITLDPVLFMALGFSAEAHGGVGSIVAFDAIGPCCIIGHATWLDGDDQIGDVDEATPTERELWDALPWQWKPNYPRNLLTELNDDMVLGVAGYGHKTGRVSFAKWCEIIGVDVSNA